MVCELRSSFFRFSSVRLRPVRILYFHRRFNFREALQLSFFFQFDVQTEGTKCIEVDSHI